MKSHRQWGHVVSSAILLVIAVSVPALAQDQDAVAQARRLYASAAYDEALAALGNADDPDAQQYRALCLLALGRQQQAEAAIAALVSSSPQFVGQGEEMPPRFVTLLKETRQRLLPGILRELFTDGRKQFQAKAFEPALRKFETVIAFSSDPMLRDLEEISDLRLLASGFIDLAEKSEEPKAPPVNVVEPPATPSRAAAPTTTPPVAIRQNIPTWPPDAGPIELANPGAVRVRIDSEGKVISATMVNKVNPRYDIRLIANALSWRYTPATLNGMPIESETTVEIRLRPQP